MEKFKELRPELLPDTSLNRMLFIEVLIMFAVEASKSEVGASSNLGKADTLKSLFKNHIEPYVAGQGTKIEETLRKFRQDFVWQEENNKILQMNMEGIMRIFDKFSEPNDKGFTNKSAFKLIKGIGSTVKDKVIQ